MNKNVYICINESLCCTAVINTTLEFNYTSIKKNQDITQPLGWLLSKNTSETSVGKDMEILEPLYTIGGIVKWCICYGRQYEVSSEN